MRTQETQEKNLRIARGYACYDVSQAIHASNYSRDDKVMSLTAPCAGKGATETQRVTANTAAQRWTKGRKAMIDDFDGAEILHCPYCGRAQDTHEDDEISANCCLTECEHCGKSFWYSVDVTRAYWPRKDDTEDAK